MKLLDFGIARLLGSDSGDEALTRTGSAVLTPHYASPEQVRAEPVSTASDVYQLGLLLFQLLTGRRAHDLHGGLPAQAEAVFERTELSRASAAVAAEAAYARGTTVDALRRALRGDLDRIVQKALRAAPDERYESVTLLSQDVSHFLEGRPVSARPATALYRSRKFLQRNPWFGPALLLLFAFFAVYAWTAARHSAELTAERNEAREQAERAEQVQQFLVDLFGSADPYSPADPERGRNITVAEALDLSVDRLRGELLDRPVIRAALLSAISLVYENLGLYSSALPVREEALGLQRTIHGDTAAVTRASLGAHGRLLGAVAAHDSARKVLSHRLALVRQAVGDAAEETAWARLDLANLFGSIGRRADALAQADSVLQWADSLPPDVLSNAWRVRSSSLLLLSRVEDAEAAARRSLELMRQVRDDGSTSVAFARIQLASVLSTARSPGAEREFRAGIDVLERTIGPDHALTLNSLNNLAVLLQNRDDHEGAAALHAEVLERRRRVLGETHTETGGSYQNLGTALARAGRHEEARPMFERAAAVYESVLPETSYLRGLPYLSLAELELAADDAAAAEAAARRSLGVLQRALPEGNPIRAVARCRLGQARLARGDAAGEAILREASEQLTTAHSLPYHREACLSALADRLDATGRADSASVIRTLLATRN